jgi:hypothetical protein
MSRGGISGRSLVVALLAALAAGCGGGDEDSATEWADGVCSAITSWSGSVTSTTDSLQAGSLTADGLGTSVDEFESATNDFVDELRELGTPETDAGSQAKESLDELAGSIEDSVSQITAAVDDVSGVSGLLNAVSEVSAALSTMSTDVSSTYSELKSLDPGGELEQAFRDADSCDGLGS